MDDLVKRLREVESNHSGWGYAGIAADRIEELEAKLAEVVAVGVRVRDYFTHHSNDDVYAVHDFDEALAELKGQKDE
jgi:hypothetical protein